MRLLLALLCLSAQAWGAVGSAAADTWYVRPSADCANNGDGLAYNCAASAGASGAVRNFVGIASYWTATTGIDDGDTVYLCGNFVAADKRTTTVMLDFLATAASESARIYLDGDCSAAGGPAEASINGEGTVRNGVLFSTTPSSYVTMRNVYVYGDAPSPDTGGTINMGAGTGVTLDEVRSVYTRVGISLAGTSQVIEDSTIDGRAGELDAIAAATGLVSLTVSRSSIYSASTANNSDVMDIHGGSLATLVVEDSYLSKGLGDKSTITVKNGAGVVTIRDTEFYGNGAGTGYGLATEAAYAGTLHVQRNYFHGYGALVNEIQLDNATVAATANITSNVFSGGQYQIAINDNWTVTIRHNTFNDAGTYGLYSAGTSGAGPDSLTVQSNAFLSATRHINSLGYEDATTIDYNAYFGGGDFRLNGTVYATLAAAQASTTYDDNGISSNPLFAGGAAPTTAAGFRLSANSPLRRAGVELNIGNVQDQGNRAFGHPPSIGAWEAASGDAVTRTAATARTAASSRTAATARTAR